MFSSTLGSNDTVFIKGLLVQLVILKDMRTVEYMGREFPVYSRCCLYPAREQAFHESAEASILLIISIYNQNICQSICILWLFLCSEGCFNDLEIQGLACK